MSAVNFTNVTVLNNPAPFLDHYQLEISYECLEDLKEGLEWKLLHVEFAEDEHYKSDQILDSVVVGPVNVGNYKFVFEADPPDTSKIFEENIIGVSVLLLTCSYLDNEFIQVGYYVNNDYKTNELKKNPPPNVQIHEVQRYILADNPRIKKIRIDIHLENTVNGEQQPSSNADQSPEAVEKKPMEPFVPFF